ncbi:MAG: four helix bundle protein [Kaiparowitsia implicata GSE-PSE-MK54-09C]|jgi:four helix bundle protein|nr:four helix bundle protein [Kaiparowitsia implicata GSE-PSE-MK54-09C]
MQSDLKQRTKAFALRIIRVYGALPSSNQAAQVIGKRLLHSGTAIGVHYRDASRSRNRIECINKLKAGLDDLEATAYWLELLIESDLIEAAQLHKLLKEIDELAVVFNTYIQRAKGQAKQPAPR